MTVYIDGGRNQFGRMLMCHMLSDNLLELHEMAAAIGLKRRWFQPGSFPHYDVSQKKRKLALCYGAREVCRQELVTVMRMVRAAPWFEEWYFGAKPREEALMAALPDDSDALALLGGYLRSR